MSHIAAYKSTLTAVNEELLKMVLELLQEQGELEIVDHYDDYAGNKLTDSSEGRLVACVKAPGVRRGIGIVLDRSGKLKFVGDSYGCSEAFDALRKLIENTYIRLAVIKVLQQRGYDVDVESETKEGVLIRGTK